jgi:hypothetical protein
LSGKTTKIEGFSVPDRLTGCKIREAAGTVSKPDILKPPHCIIGSFRPEFNVSPGFLPLSMVFSGLKKRDDNPVN